MLNYYLSYSYSLFDRYSPADKIINETRHGRNKAPVAHVQRYITYAYSLYYIITHIRTRPRHSNLTRLFSARVIWLYEFFFQFFNFFFYRINVSV